MPGAIEKPKTLYDKVFEAHIVNQQDDGTVLLYIDRHLVHEVTSPQAFEGLENVGRKVRRPDCTLVTLDHVRLESSLHVRHYANARRISPLPQEQITRTLILLWKRTTADYSA